MDRITPPPEVRLLARPPEVRLLARLDLDTTNIRPIPPKVSDGSNNTPERLAETIPKRKAGARDIAAAAEPDISVPTQPRGDKLPNREAVREVLGLAAATPEVPNYTERLLGYVAGEPSAFQPIYLFDPFRELERLLPPPEHTQGIGRPSADRILGALGIEPRRGEETVPATRVGQNSSFC